jgi:response regulator RpfG family c-di-GMP phosphodiesterase
MTRKVLCVDDEENILRAFERNLRSHFEIETAVGAAQGLARINEQGPYAVVVSDLRMPGMDGIQFLAEVRKLSPDTVRLILSGNADLEAVIAAVNLDSIFQFLTKPCGTDRFRAALDAALKQHQLINAERELLEETLNASVAMLTEVLSMVNPVAFSRASRIRGHVRHMAAHLRMPNVWEFELAAMLSQIGCMAVPPEILEKLSTCKPLSAEEERAVESHPSVAYSLLIKIPRMELIAEIIRRQMTSFRDLGGPDIRDEVAIGAQMLKVAIYFDEAVLAGRSPQEALRFMLDRPEIYQARLVASIERTEVSPVEHRTAAIYMRDLKLNMILNEDIRSKSGLYLIPKGQLVSEPVMARMMNFNKSMGIIEPFSVLVPLSRPSTLPKVPARELVH